MLKPFIAATLAAALLTSCASMKPLGIKKNQQVSDAPTTVKKEVKFLENISIETKPENTIAVSSKKSVEPVSEQSQGPDASSALLKNPDIESAPGIQIKYSILLNTEVEQVQNVRLYQYIDEWYGTRYCMGGTTKSCIDCSAFMQLLFSSMYGLSLPRTARDQYKSVRKISRTEMQEGDLLFFNTTGGVSHVGMYLQNNKFVHASSSGGVMISDVFDAYWVKRFISVGRLEKSL